MHSYLRAIGFSKYKSRKQLESIYQATLKNPNRKIVTTVSVDTSMIQLEKDFAEKMGIALVGEFDISDNLSIEHYYPYAKGDVFMDYERITIEKQTDKESYAGVCEDYRLGMTLIFYVTNIADYAKSKWFNYSNRDFTKVKFSGLSTKGSIILGTDTSDAFRNRNTKKADIRYNLYEAAKSGDADAIESLTLDEMDTYSLINNRLKNEDILSIIDTSFMPCGVECDHYMIVGNILKVTESTNFHTDETVYNLMVETNDIIINVCINKLDLQGEPLVGRRFHGEIWLQGIVQI